VNEKIGPVTIRWSERNTVVSIDPVGKNVLSPDRRSTEKGRGVVPCNDLLRKRIFTVSAGSTVVRKMLHLPQRELAEREPGGSLQKLPEELNCVHEESRCCVFFVCWSWARCPLLQHKRNVASTLAYILHLGFDEVDRLVQSGLSEAD